MINTAICFSFIAASDIPRAATRAEQRCRTTSTVGNTDSQRAQVQITAQVWWRRMALSVSSSARTYRVHHQTHRSSKLISLAGTQCCCCCNRIQELQVRSTPGRGYPCSRHQFGSAAKTYKFTYVFFCLLPFLSLLWHQPAAVRQ